MPVRALPGRAYVRDVDRRPAALAADHRPRAPGGARLRVLAADGGRGDRLRHALADPDQHGRRDRAGSARAARRRADTAALAIAHRGQRDRSRGAACDHRRRPARHGGRRDPRRRRRDGRHAGGARLRDGVRPAGDPTRRHVRLHHHHRPARRRPQRRRGGGQPPVAGRRRRAGGAGATLTASLHRLSGLAPWLLGFLPLVVGLVIWELIPSAHGSPFFPAPSEWLDALRSQHGFGEIVSELAATLRSVVLGLLVATIVGSVIGIAVGFFRVVRLSLSTTLEFLRALPAPVIIPIAVLALGQTETMKVFCVAFASVWPVLLNSASAASSTNALLVDVGRTLQLSRAEQVRKVVLPSTVPSILLGVRVALPVALILTILIEMLGSNVGIGSLLIEAQRAYQSADAFGLLFVVGIFGFALNAVFAGIGWLFLRRWPEGAEVG
ncbi:MAG: ABC transporter permease subunit [Solirubrobacterales bacterium]|nr:ABC transporter permease subunit [Solirubrobacterales bacterium]